MRQQREQDRVTRAADLSQHVKQLPKAVADTMRRYTSLLRVDVPPPAVLQRMRVDGLTEDAITTFFGPFHPDLDLSLSEYHLVLLQRGIVLPPACLPFLPLLRNGVSIDELATTMRLRSVSPGDIGVFLGPFVYRLSMPLTSSSSSSSAGRAPVSGLVAADSPLEAVVRSAECAASEAELLCAWSLCEELLLNRGAGDDAAEARARLHIRQVLAACGRELCFHKPSLWTHSVAAKFGRVLLLVLGDAAAPPS
jgi:hypothetical protein